MNKRGFLLIECVMYCALLAILMCATLHLTLRVYQASRHAGATCTAWSQLETALDVFSRDVAQALPIAAHWEKDVSHIQFQTNEASAISWGLHKGSLVRRAREYNTQKKTWRSAVKSVAIEKCADMHLDVAINDEGHAQSVTLRCIAEINSKKYEIERTAYLYNRMLS